MSTLLTLPKGQNMDWTAIYGYWVLAGDTIIIVTSLGLLVICNFGFSVYHVAMWRNENTNYFILNVLYEQLAIVFQLNSVRLMAQVSDTCVPV